MKWCYDKVPNFKDDIMQLLLSDGFAMKKETSSITAIKKFDFDRTVPYIAGNHIKWHEESPDLFVLFNTQIMSNINPLLTLGPYGSLVWRSLINGEPIGQIRSQAQRIFGSDEVVPFIRRLRSLGFIKMTSMIEQSACQKEKIVKEFPAPVTQFQLRQPLIPWYCLWEICSVCNLRCKTCYLKSFTGHGPSTEEALRIVKQLVDAGMFYVCLLGGEPLMRPDIEKIVENFKLNGVFVKIICNGLELTAERAKKLSDSGLNQIEVSFDGLRPSSHDASRGTGMFSVSTRAIESAMQANIPRVGMVWTAYKDNVKEIQLLPKFMQDLNVRECYISPFRKTGILGAASTFESLDANDIEYLENSLNKYQSQFPELNIALLSQCTCGKTSIVISENGDVRPCPFEYTSIGNVHTRNFYEIWKSVAGNASKANSPAYCKKAIIQN